MSGTRPFEGTQGTIVTTFCGIARDTSQPHQWARGRWWIVSGTGAYAGLDGRERFTIVVDVAGNHLIGTSTGTAR